ncbi:transporter [Caenimonas koreensis DSM 17982]|uniref:Transporter n=1 Tax=Caenimonas koreensis DSM 17982 TaxID=1121255 RepID=A0A844AZ99_9BURK|nr:BON domain-containing protein [Caenimonas koreensis]MRD46382.1 transporter [Caenimonas koreensis DSM 17982]
MKRWVYVLFCCLGAESALAQDTQNYFDDPFLQVTAGVANCPVPQPPGMTQAELPAAAHVRSQHGGSCFRAGRCRLPDSYLYDKEIIPRVKIYLTQDDRYANTSIWAQGERRLVTLMGCVQSEQQSQEIERSVNLIDDVMGVINYLMVGTQATPKYKVITPKP